MRIWLDRFNVMSCTVHIALSLTSVVSVRFIPIALLYLATAAVTVTNCTNATVSKLNITPFVNNSFTFFKSAYYV
jgi:Cu/Ag efflux pump CusA